MNRYALKTKDGEVVNTIKAESKYEAAELFAKIKKISVHDLLEIYDVDGFVK